MPDPIFGKNITQKLSRDYELISVSYHEAGHCLFGLLNHIKITTVAVNSETNNSEDLGYTQYEIAEIEHQDTNVLNRLLMAEIGINYAGLAAERIYYKDICGSDKLPMMLKGGSSEDIKTAASLIKKFELAAPGKKRYAFKQKMLRDCKLLLEEHWEAVKLIAHSLYRHKKLTFFDLKDILTKKSSNKEFWKTRFKEINLLFDSPTQLDVKTIRSILIN
jgi:hypothetical protein